MMPLVELRDVEKTYRLGKTEVHAIRGVSLDIEPGAFICIVGPSGCGKTTLLNMIGCIDAPTAGALRMDGRELGSLSDSEAADLRLDRMGFIFQSFNLVPVLTVVENIAFPNLLAGTPRREGRQRARDLAEAVGLAEQADLRPDELSGGQRQRVAIARALTNDPELVIADEPTANLDSETGGMVLDVMRAMHRGQQVSFVFSTHDPAITEYAERIVHLRDGRIERIDGPRDR